MSRKKVYEYVNPASGVTERKVMNPNFVFDQEEFYKGVHRHFSCSDCHSPDYSSFPHQSELRFEPMYSCLDCHGGDEKFATYHFETIEEEFEKAFTPAVMANSSTAGCVTTHTLTRL